MDDIKELLERMRSPHNSLVTQSFLLNEGANVIEKLQSRIEELEATILQMGENAAKNAKYYEARIEKLKDDKAELGVENARLKAQPFGAIHTDGSRSGGQPIKGTNDER